MTETEQIQAHIKQMQALVDRKNLALKLEKVPEFGKLILDEFCTTECARFAQNSANPALSDRERADSLGMAQAAGHLRRYLSMCVTEGLKAEREIAEAEEALDEMRAEGQE